MSGFDGIPINLPTQRLKILFKLETRTPASPMGFTPKRRLQLSLFSLLTLLMLSPLTKRSYAQVADDTTKTVPSSPSTQPRSDIQTHINYDARDSIRFNVKEQKVILYKDAHVDYGNMSMDADFIAIDWNSHTVLATYSTDSTGKKQGIPHVKQGDQVFEADTIIYNYETQRGYISGIVTQEGEGYLQGKGALKDEYNQLYIKNGKYTTCNKAEPHYHFRLKKTKVIPGDKVVSGPVNLYIDEIPTPLAVPFGIFPLAEEQQSGLIIPAFGEQRDRGFMLTGLGYYWYVNDYLGIKFLGDIYSLGGGKIRVESDYKKRYKYTGGIDLQYVRNIRGENPFGLESTKDYLFKWNHAPVSKSGRSFSSDVNLQTTTYNLNGVNQDVNDYIKNNINSNITFTTPLGKYLRTAIKLRHNQNNKTGIYNFTLPDATISINRINPFQSKKPSAKKKTAFKSFYESINFSYTGNFKYLFSNAPSVPRFDFEVANEELFKDDSDTIDFAARNFDRIFDRGQADMVHNIPISASLKLLKYFSFNPSFNYRAFMYDRRYDYVANPEDSTVSVSRTNGFAFAQEYSTSATLNTTFYGFYGSSKGAPLIRHQIQPIAGFTYRPDFGENENYYRQISVGDFNRRVSRFQGQGISTPGANKQAALTLELRNSFELKVRDRSIEDSVAYKKLKLLDLNLKNSHNFAVDSLRWSDLNFNGNSSILQNAISLGFNGSFEPYSYRLDSTGTTQQITKDFEGGLGNLETASIRLTTDFFKLVNIATKRKTKEEDAEDENAEEKKETEAKPKEPYPYVDFDMPWTLRVDYTLNYSQVGELESTVTQNMTFTGGIDLTKNWEINGSVQYDITNNRLTLPKIGIQRMLHCWQMSLGWTPFGPYQQYNFYIGVNASQLKDLKYDRRKSYTGQTL